MSDPTPPPVADEGMLPPIDRDEAMKRDYIPLPGGWEIQTKGKGSTFRIANSKTGEQFPILDDMAHMALVQMALAVRDAWNTRAAVLARMDRRAVIEACVAALKDKQKMLIDVGCDGPVVNAFSSAMGVIRSLADKETGNG